MSLRSRSVPPIAVGRLREAGYTIVQLTPEQLTLLTVQGLLLVACTVAVGVAVWGQLWLMILLVLTTLFGAWRILSSAYWQSIRLVLGEDRLIVSRGGVRVREIPYRELEGYRFGGAKDFHWLNVNYIGGKPALEISRRSFVYFPNEAQKAIYRIMGSRIASQSSHPRMNRPINLVAARLFDYFDEPPAVQMQPGVRYRYISSSDMSVFLGPSNLERRYWVLLAPVAFLLPTLEGAYGVITILYCVSVFLLLMRLIFPRICMTRSLRDEFEMTDEGLKVFRNHRSWVVRNPRSVVGFSGLSIADTPVIQYRNGLDAYYFDPRFIEPVG